MFKIKLLSFVISFSCISNIFASDLNVKIYPKPGNYSNPRVALLKSDDKTAKIMWTTNPNGSPDETFIYNTPIKIRFSTILWYFAFNDNNDITAFKKARYNIRANPNRYSKDIEISSFSPYKDIVTLKNTWEKTVNLKYWTLNTRHWNYEFKNSFIWSKNYSLLFFVDKFYSII